MPPLDRPRRRHVNEAHPFAAGGAAANERREAAAACNNAPDQPDASVRASSSIGTLHSFVKEFWKNKTRSSVNVAVREQNDIAAERCDTLTNKNFQQIEDTMEREKQRQKRLQEREKQRQERLQTHQAVLYKHWKTKSILFALKVTPRNLPRQALTA